MSFALTLFCNCFHSHSEAAKNDMISVIDSSATVRGVAGLQCESALPPSVPLRELLAREPCNEHLERYGI